MRSILASEVCRSSFMRPSAATGPCSSARYIRNATRSSTDTRPDAASTPPAPMTSAVVRLLNNSMRGWYSALLVNAVMTLTEKSRARYSILSDPMSCRLNAWISRMPE